MILAATEQVAASADAVGLKIELRQRKGADTCTVSIESKPCIIRRVEPLASWLELYKSTDKSNHIDNQDTTRNAADCVYVCNCVCAYACAHVYVPARVSACGFARTCPCEPGNVYVVYLRMRICICVCMWSGAWVTVEVACTTSNIQAFTMVIKHSRITSRYVQWAWGNKVLCNHTWSQTHSGDDVIIAYTKNYYLISPVIRRALRSAEIRSCPMHGLGLGCAQCLDGQTMR